MYWVVFSVALLAESWISFILVWIPFYGYLRLFFLLYLILPQTQGARVIYQTYVHPFLEDNESQIDDFIASAHDRLKAAGVAYVKHAIEFVKTNVLGLPPTETPEPEPTSISQTYTQALLSRFSVPAARSANAGTDVYNLLASAVAAAGTAAGTLNNGRRESLIPRDLQSSGEKMTFITAQRERLNILLSALENEAQEVQAAEQHAHQNRARSMNVDGPDEDDEVTQRPPSGLSAWSALSKSRSEVDFEKIDAESGAEDEGSVRRRNVPQQHGGWMPWNWSAAGQQPPPGTSSGMDQ